MQQKNDTSRNFLVRTDALAAHLGINVQDLPDFIGIGRASLFCCRSGERPISNKTWHKLEAAEKAAGMGLAKEPEKKELHTPPADLHEEISELKERLGNIERLLEQVLARDAAPKMSSVARGKSA